METRSSRSPVPAPVDHRAAGQLDPIWLLTIPATWLATALLAPVVGRLDLPVSLGLVYAVVIGVAAWVLVRHARAAGLALADVGLRASFRLRYALVALLGFFVLGQLWVPIELALGAVGETMLWPGRSEALAGTTGEARVLLVVVGVLLIPFFEEVVYRGYLVRQLQERAWPTWAVITGTAALFAASHLGLGLGLTLYTLPLGILLAWITVRTGTITYAVGVHALNNGFAYVVVPVLFG